MSNPNVGQVFNLTGSNGGSGSLKLENLAITQPPAKTTYKSGESFDPTGMIVTARYAYGITSDVTGYTVSPNVLLDGTTVVTITYTEGRVTKTVTTPVTVEKVLSSLVITAPPTKTEYDYLETFDPAGMGVSAVFSDGSTVPVTTYTYPSTQFTTLGAQGAEIGYTYEGVTKTINQSVTVNAIRLPLPVQKDIPSYDGSSKSPSWDNFEADKMTVTGDTTGINAKENYSTTFTLSYGYLFTDGGSSATVNWKIDRAVIAALPTQRDIPAYDGSVKSPSWDGYDAVKMTISGDQYGTAAADYTATFTPTSNYKWWDDTVAPKDVTWQIVTVLVTIPTQTNVPTYDGTAKTPEWSNYDTEHSTVTVLPATDAGEHEATFSLLSGTWSDGTTQPKTITWVIDRAVLDELPAQAGTLTYDGNPKTPSWNAKYDSNKMTLAVTPATLAGTTYSASFTPTSNYKWWDDSTETKTATWAIGKAAGSSSSSPTTLTLNAANPTGSIVITRLGNGAITAVSSNTNIITVVSVNQSSGEIALATVNDTSGTATITVNVAEGDNYLAPVALEIAVTASFREYLYGFDLTNSDQNPATRVAYPSDVENADFTAAKTTGTTFSYGSWPSTPGEKFMPKPCMLKFDGTVDYYLNPNDLTKKADGSASDVANVNYAGNAMMEWPKIYTKRWESGGVYHFRCSDVKVDEDYECWCNYDINNHEIDHFYTPIFFGSKDSSNRMRSISGQANWVNTTGAQAEIDAAKLNGNDWFIEVLADRLLIQDLLVLMFKSTDLQATAGMGVVSASAAIAPGTMNNKGLFSGDVSGKTTGVKVFGMENWWGNIWRRTAGWIANAGSEKVKLTRGTKDGTTAADYNLDGTGYLTVETISWNGNCINTMTTKPYGRLPKTTAGSTTTYEPDYAHVDTSGVRVAFVGGYWGNDLNAGPFYVGLNGGASRSYANIGAALSCKPRAAA